jgi:nucleobase:cation symporter-1, NCS1 family
VVALGVGALLAVGGAYSTPGNGPFPQNGLISALKPLYDYSWVVGFAVSLLLYATLSTLSPQRQLAKAPAPAS